MSKLTKEQRKVLKDLRNLCDEALEEDTADNVIVALGNKFIEFGKVFMPPEVLHASLLPDPLYSIAQSGRKIFEQEVKGGQVVSEREVSPLEYWEKELDKMDKKEKGGKTNGSKDSFV